MKAVKGTTRFWQRLIEKTNFSSLYIRWDREKSKYRKKNLRLRLQDILLWSNIFIIFISFLMCFYCINIKDNCAKRKSINDPVLANSRARNEL